MSGGLHPPKEGRARVRGLHDALHSSRRIHCLRGLRTGLSCDGHLPGGQCSGTMAELHRHELRTFRNSEKVKPLGGKFGDSEQFPDLGKLLTVPEFVVWHHSCQYQISSYYLKSSASSLHLQNSRNTHTFTASKSTIP